MDDIDVGEPDDDATDAEAAVQRALDWRVPVEDLYTALESLTAQAPQPASAAEALAPTPSAPF